MKWRNIKDVYSLATWFESRSGHQLSWIRFFIDLFSPSKLMLGYYFQVGHDSLSPNSYFLTNHLIISHSTLIILAVETLLLNISRISHRVVIYDGYETQQYIAFLPWSE
jgi:hypothetical protein